MGKKFGAGVKSKFTKPKAAKTKSTSSSRSSKDVSPLMADEAKASSTSSSSKSKSKSSALKEEERAKQRSEREARRDKRDKRMEDQSASKKAASSKSKKKSKPKLSQEERDAKDSKLGCCHKFAQFLAKFVHLLDGLIGLTFLVYGGLIATEFENPAQEAVVTCLTFGTTLLATSIVGAIGFYTSVCWRVGLLISAYIAPFIAFFYVFVIIALLSSPDTYFDYLAEHKDVLYLNDAEIATLRQILPFFYIVMACLTAVEVVRFLGLRKIHATMVKFDAANKRIASSERSSSRSNRSASKRSNASSKSKKSSKQGSNTSLTEPLLDHDEEMGEASDDSDW